MNNRPCTITPISGGLLVQTPYDAGFLAAIKSIPTSERRFDPDTKGWIVAPQHGQRVGQWIQQYYGQMVLIPQVNSKPTLDMRVLDVRYVGICKDRGSEISAFGYSERRWSVIFPEDVLRQWFEGVITQSARPQSTKNTLYTVLGIRSDAAGDEVKKAYRRMALQWHPDHCKEPDAAERFIKIKEAYDLLIDPDKRARYDAGLMLEASLGMLGNTPPWMNRQQLGNYRAPLRCGLVLAEGYDTVGYFRVTRILEWEDIKNAYGQTLVVSWPAGSDKFVEQWVG